MKLTTDTVTIITANILKKTVRGRAILYFYLKIRVEK